MKKISALYRILAFALVLCLCSAFVPMMTFAEVTEPPTDTETTWSVYDPNEAPSTKLATDADGAYLIQSAADLKHYEANWADYKGDTIKLTKNIKWNDGDASTWNSSTTGLNSWTPMGGWSGWYGTFDGQGYTISGLYTVSASYASFFGGVSGGTAVIKDLAIVNSYFKATTQCAASFVGVVATNGVLTLENTYSDAIIVNDGHSSGGLVGSSWQGESKVTVNNSVFAGSVTGGNRVGGIVGSVANVGSAVTVTNSLNLGSVQGSYTVGGIFGGFATSHGNITVTNCINLGTVSATNNGEVPYAICGKAITITLSGNIYDSSMAISAKAATIDGNTGMAIADIKAMDEAALTTAGLTNWTPAVVDGKTLPVPSAIVDLIPESEPEPIPDPISATINATVAGKDATVQLLGEGVDESKVSENNAVSFTVAGLTEGTYNYTLQITDEDAAGWTYDSSVKEVTVVVDAKGNVTYEGNNPTFTNTYVAAGTSATINVNVNVEGKDFNADDFTLLVDGVETAIENGKVTLTYKYEKETTETYNFELVSKNAGIKIAEEEATKAVTVTVTDDKNGNLVATGVEDVTFNATYTANGTSATIGANVTLNGEVSDKNFVILVDGEEVAVVDGKISLLKEYTTAGTYTYTLTQKNTELGGVTYDNAKHVITVAVTDNGEGQLDATVEGNNPTFANTYDYKVDTNVIINVNVSVTDRTLAEGDISATLTKGEDVIVTGKIDAEGKIVFTIPASKYMAGDYVVTLSTEVAGITLSDAQTVTVTVKDNGDGTSTVTPADETTLTFTGTYEVPFVAGGIQDVNGVLTYVSTATGNGVELGLVKIDGYYYYVGPNGVLVTNQDYYAWQLNKECDKAKGWYTFDETGKMVISGLYKDRYYVDAIPTEVGLFYNEADNTYYCAGPNGKLVTDKEYYVWKIHTSAQDAFACNWYRFDETGALYQGIYNGYYYKNGKTADVGLFELDGKYYFANAGGKIVAAGELNEYGDSGSYYVWKTETGLESLKGWREFDEDGVMRTPRYGVHRDKDGYLYYFEDDKKKDIGLFYNEEDGNFYCANSGGKLVAAGVENEYGTSGSYYVWKIHESAKDMKPGWYEFDAEGKLIVK